VDFFIVNVTDRSYSRDDLNTMLQVLNRNPEVTLSPDIYLKYNRMVNGQPRGYIERIVIDREFNPADKGELVAELDKNDVSIKVQRIREWAVMKATISIGGLPMLEVPVSRMAKGSVPFDFEQYQSGCYSR
jgi:hypothetical protein